MKILVKKDRVIIGYNVYTYIWTHSLEHAKKQTYSSVGGKVERLMLNTILLKRLPMYQRPRFALLFEHMC